jgi:hypothetical protein
MFSMLQLYRSRNKIYLDNAILGLRSLREILRHHMQANEQPVSHKLISFVLGS